MVVSLTNQLLLEYGTKLIHTSKHFQLQKGLPVNDSDSASDTRIRRKDVQAFSHNL
jgi:hypothetical protein